MSRLILLILTLIFVAPMSMAQQVGVPFNGLVVDGQGKGIGRMRVEVKGTDKRTVSDKMGRFGLTDLADDAVLVFRRKGTKVEVSVNGRRSLRVMLIGEAISQADESQELVDLGIGYVRRREFNSSFGVITGEELRRENPGQDLETALQGRVAGLTTAHGEITLRGHNSLSYSSAPLFMVDGTEVSSLSNISVHDVETVTVHKDGSMYGQRGANGVIVVKLR
jgi:hypothetical protein